MLEYPFGLLGKSLLVAAVFALYLIPSGYVVAWLSNLAGFRRRSVAEKLAWSLALSFPLSTIIAAGIGHFVGERIVQGTFAVFLAAMMVIALHEWRQKHVAGGEQSMIPRMLVLALCIACGLCLFAALPVVEHGHLEEGLLTNDWYIRLPLLYSATRGGVPPANPLFTLAGQTPTLRYYYFFYVLCAEPLKLLGHTLGDNGPRAALIASTLWSCAAFFCVAWLMLKHLVLREEDESGQTRQHMLAFVAVSLIAGLDLVPNSVALLLGGRLYPTLFWWGESMTPWPGTLPFAPHHYAGLAMAMLGYMLVSRETQKHQRWIAAALGAVCFAAALGTSTFIATAVMASACVLVLSEILRRRWMSSTTIAVTLAGAIAVDWFFIVPTFLRPEHAAATNGSHGLPLKLVLQHWHQAYGLTGQLLVRLFRTQPPHGVAAYLLSLPMLLALFLIQWGFFWIVLGWRARRDLSNSNSMTTKQRALWCLFGTCALLAAFVSSAPLQHGINDFGRHTLLAATFVLMLWASPLLASAWHRGRAPGRWLAVATTFAAIGFAGTAWDVTVQRFYLPLVDANVVQPRDPFFYQPDVGVRYAELHDAWRGLGEKTAADAVVQGNPDGPLQRPFLLYLNRRVAAGDISCETAFGGDESICRNEIVRPLLALYEQLETRPELKLQFDASPAAFEATCRHLHLAAMVATDYDPVWTDMKSWVWREPAFYTGQYVRAIACPQ